MTILADPGNEVIIIHKFELCSPVNIRRNKLVRFFARYKTTHKWYNCFTSPEYPDYLFLEISIYDIICNTTHSCKLYKRSSSFPCFFTLAELCELFNLEKIKTLKTLM